MPSFPQTLSGELDERIFERRPLDADIFHLEALRLDPLDQLDHRARRPPRQDCECHAALIHADRISSDLRRIACERPVPSQA